MSNILEDADGLFPKLVVHIPLMPSTRSACATGKWLVPLSFCVASDLSPSIWTPVVVGPWSKLYRSIWTPSEMFVPPLMCWTLACHLSGMTVRACLSKVRIKMGVTVVDHRMQNGCAQMMHGNSGPLPLPDNQGLRQRSRTARSWWWRLWIPRGLIIAFICLTWWCNPMLSILVPNLNGHFSF